ncbi:MAG: hypothetical protein HUJ23_01370 [Methylophaga sp.]|nr:hypothetical protein [Methylophaga sp.]
MIANTDVLNQLAQLCHQAETGTFFITTTDNKACHILLENGRINALSFGRERGKAVITTLPFIKVERFSFQQNVIMPLPSKAYVDDRENLLASLGLHHAELSSTSGKRMYRGAEVDTKRTIPSLKKAATEASKKPARMYRGRPVQD